MTPQPTTTAPTRVRVRNDHRTEGVLVDVDEEGCVMWVDSENFCHFSKGDWVEVMR